MGDRTIKTWLDGDVRRFALSSELSLSFQTLCQTICNLYSLNDDRFLKTYIIQYTDEEEDLITISNQEELQEAWRNTDDILRIQLVCKAPRSSAVNVAGAAPVTAAATERMSKKEVVEKTPVETVLASSEPHLKENNNKENNASGSEIDSDSDSGSSMSSSNSSKDSATESDDDSNDDFDSPNVNPLKTIVNGIKDTLKPMLKQWKEQSRNRRNARREAATANAEALRVEGNGTDEDKLAASFLNEHLNIVCDGCSEPVIGSRFKCLKCPDFDLCSACESKGMHPNHPMLRVRIDGLFPRLVENGLHHHRGRQHSGGRHHHRGPRGPPREEGPHRQRRHPGCRRFPSSQQEHQRNGPPHPPPPPFPGMHAPPFPPHFPGGIPMPPPGMPAPPAPGMFMPGQHTEDFAFSFPMPPSAGYFYAGEPPFPPPFPPPPFPEESNTHPNQESNETSNSNDQPDQRPSGAQRHFHVPPHMRYAHFG